MRALFLIASFCTGCGAIQPPADGGPTACEDGRLEVGSGGSRLYALPEEGGELPIVRGAQGGIHVIVGFWMRELPLELEARYWLDDPASGERVGNETVLALTPSLFTADGARYQRHPDLLVLNNEAPNVADFAGRMVRLHASARAGADASCDVRTVTIVDLEAP